MLFVGLAVGCGNAVEASTASPEPPQPYSFTPSPMLELARSERELPPVRRQWVRKRFETPAPEDTELDEDGIARTVRIHPFRLATPEELARAALRRAESRRPRELHETRFLIRARKVSGPSHAVRRRARLMVDAQDGAVATCLAEDLAARPDVILRAPTALVLEEARRTGPTVYGITVKYNGRRPPKVETSPPVHDAAQACLESALAPGPGDKPRTAKVELTAFDEMAYSPEDPKMHRVLANEAAVLGWIELERGETEAALAYFEDAHWLYHRPEYELLQAMALQKMGRPNMALTRYRRFVDARPHAPETPMLEERIAALELQRGAAEGSETSDHACSGPQ